MPVAGYKSICWLDPLAGVRWHSLQNNSIIGRRLMITIVGIDPHPQHHTAAALDEQGQVQGVQQFPNSAAELDACLALLEELEEVRLAVEGPTQTFPSAPIRTCFALWLTRFLAEGLVVVPIPTQLVRERRGRRKTDPQDAVLIARVLQAEPDRPAFTPPAWLRSLQELTRTRRHLAQQIQADCMRLRTAQTPAVQTSLQCMVAALAGAVQELEGQIQQQVQALAPSFWDFWEWAQSSLGCCWPKWGISSASGPRTILPATVGWRRCPGRAGPANRSGSIAVATGG
jgi:hypothetical protein